ncbi:MAG: Nucleic acid-binding protein [uncultured Sulfurovum sp.]|uniref:Nucleic acid-binding protein n=1 Tax=uncultured Sulfurovum sp. TaxID=269237 RepID=A0A6S6SE65_9BACT|nr:MAG: Nucleic acid-binding protein [uncultured Sulfurovum sp.]
MIVVSNATPIISLASIDKIDILKHFFDRVYIAQAVYDEIKSKRAFGYQEIDDDFFQIEHIKDDFSQNILLNDLDLGEAQTIVLAKEMGADIVLIDETIGYNIAKSQELNVKRTLSFLIASKKRGYIDEVKPLLDEMIDKGRWISRKVYRDVLRFCDE